MNKDEAISLAAALVRRHPIADKINFDAATARFVDGAKEMEEARADSPEMNLDFTIEDYWDVELPFWKEDQFQRASLFVTIDPVTKQAEIVEDLA